MKVDSIYIIHYNKNIDRKKYLDEQLQSVSVPFLYRSLYDRDSLEILDERYFDISSQNRDKRNLIMLPFEKRVSIGPDNTTIKGKAYRAVTLEHYKTFEHIIFNTTDNWSLILEDDAMFKEPLQDIINFYENCIPDNCDICYLGSGCQLSISYTKGEPLVENHQKHSRCSDSYIIKRSAVNQILNTALPFFTVIDWELNYLQMLNNFTVYWATEPKIYQGSQTGNYGSCFHIFE